MKRKIYLNKVSLNEALTTYLALFKDQIISDEIIEVNQACGRITAEEIFAQRSAPHFYASAMDGIAVKAEDTAGASERNPLQLKEGETAERVDTGDPIPVGLNAVIKIEEINEKNDGFLEIEKGVTPWENVRVIGESVIKGQQILPVNHKLTPYDLGALLEAGITQLKVSKKPSVGIIPTGSELVPAGQTPVRGELTEFNSTMLTAYTEQWGGKAEVSPIIPDNYEDIKANVQSMLPDHEIMVIIAGSSAGEEDYTVSILQELGEVIFHGVNIMPGKPVILARIDNKPVLGIPGYPLAALLNNFLFVRPLVYHLAGQKAPVVPERAAVVKRKVPSRIGLKEFLRVNLALIGEDLIAVPRKRGSAAMESLLRADGIMAIPEQKEGLSPGSKLPVYLLKEEAEIEQNLLLVGSHDLTLDVLANLLRKNRTGFNLNIQPVGSMAGLMSLKRGECHLAGAHLLDEKTGEYNTAFIRRILPDREMALITLVFRQQGLMVNRDNPKGIKSIADLTRADIDFINRQRGAGTRVLLDYWLKERKINPEEIAGYDREEFTHIGAAAAVSSGSADTALGILAAARAMELDFIPLLEERYDLVIPRELLEDRRITKIIEILESQEFKDAVTALGGYRVEDSGNIILV